MAIFALCVSAPSWSADWPEPSRTIDSPTQRVKSGLEHLDTPLNLLLSSWSVDRETAQREAQKRGVKFEGDSVFVTVRMLDPEAADPAVQTLQQLGGRVTARFGPSIDAWLPVPALRGVNEIPGLSLIYRPIPPMALEDEAQSEPEAWAGAYLTQGVSASNAAAWHSSGFDGAGVSVAVIDSFQDVDTAISMGELPASTMCYPDCYSLDYSERHGTACAEIIHDMAPQASLTLSSAGTSTAAAQRIVQLASVGHDIISASMAWLDPYSPGDGTGIMSDAIGQARNSHGTLYVGSAGNNAKYHWDGYFTDTNGNWYHEFSPGWEVNKLDSTVGMWAGTEISVYLRWNDWPVTNQDFDLELRYWNGFEWILVESSDIRQTGTQPPFEFLTTEAPWNGLYSILIVQYLASTAPVMDLMTWGRHELDFKNSNRSLVEPATSPDSFSVAAVDVNSFLLEDYSSWGPTYGPGGALNGGHAQPRIAAFANVDTWSYGPGGFNGTSSACPHVAGATALVRGAYPTYSPAQTQTYLEGRAIDGGTAGYDYKYGYGRLWLGNPPASCTYSISPTSASYSASGGSGNFSVTTQAGCAWTATSSNNWIHITGGASGSGNGTVSYSVDANGSSSSRTGTISAAGRTFTITQAGATSCTYSISPTSATYGANGGSGSFSMTTQAGCTWTASANNNWIHITGGASGTGNGTVSYSVDANGSSSSRTGTISAADKTFSITQAGATSCTYSISPTSAAYGANGGNGSFSVTTQAGCAWTVTSNNNWIHITGGASGSGNGTVSYSVDANGGSSSRTGTISAADKTFTITQSGATSCTYSISPTSATYGASGGNGSVSVSTAAGCTWTASSNNGWIHVTSGSSGTGSGTVNYSVDANSGGSRTGTMTVGGHTFTVTQSGGGGGGPYYYEVAGIAHAGGAGGSVWRSTLCVTNMSGSTADLTLVYRMGGNTVTRTHMLQNNRIKEWEDVAVSLFNQSANTSGAIEIVSSLPVMVVARTYNEAPDGTFGQGMPGNDESATLTSGQMGILPQLKKTSSFRTNVGLMNHGASACNVRIRLFSENGNQLGNTIDTTVPAEQWKQINDVFDEAGVGQCQIGYATVEVLTAGGRVWAYGSVVDNGTGDPTTIPLFIE